MLTSAENVDLLMRLVGVVIVDDRHLVRKVIVFGRLRRASSGGATDQPAKSASMKRMLEAAIEFQR
jgi:hypothetical protein